MAQVKMYTSNYCPFCSRAKALLQQSGVTDLEEVNVDGTPEVRAHMTQLTGRTSVPQIFIDETLVGGCDDLYALEARGELQTMLKA
ncbi:glutaredoxin 3 [Hydrogenophaga crassostreae]|uniref:Glutaredoxin n=1 Tax=Hydrogenophaga crassostreae TaxID=1763535 RepID=A0A167I9J8_9BURK|nr:glutaredoxin 3 [Hydrogenophaga crassostreae]AOW12344.1 glutaredoxin 3 [Hydrogenophaga crassostreae]OAD42395.1 glutaredoxin 3 [Hydrogenophaga crassostreae]